MIFRRDAATSIQGAAGPDSIRTQADAVWMSRPPPPSGEEEDQLILTDLSIVTEMLQVVACPHCKQHRLSMHAGRVMGYAVEMALSCDSCGKELDRRFSSRKMATDQTSRGSHFVSTGVMKLYAG